MATGKKYKKLAEKNGLETEWGKGDHLKIKGPAGRGYMTVPMSGDLDKGTESAIKKWFKALGIAVAIMVPPMLCLFTALLRSVQP